MKKILHYLSLVIVLAMVGWCESSDYDKVGYAPPEAFEAGSKYPYYGSYTERGFIESAFTADIQTLYKRFGQQQILEIVRGKPEEAVRHCRIRLAENPDDPEFLYALSVAQCQLGDVKSAIQTMKEALSNGFPFERFLAGPRNLLRPLTETEAFQEVAARYGRQLIHGPLLGCVTNRSAKFWVRTVSESPMQVRVSRFKNLARPIESEVQITDSNQDYTTVVGVSGLQPATTYYYDLTIDGKSELGPAYPSFRTYPSGGETDCFFIILPSMILPYTLQAETHTIRKTNGGMMDGRIMKPIGCKS